jgi:hypothetical protein
MKPALIFAASVLLVVPSVHAQAHKHVHGEGRLDVAIEKDSIAFDLELPLDTVVGFEHAPQTTKEKAAFAEAHQTLQDAAVLFLPTAAAQCTVREAKAEMPDFKDAHADFDVSYRFQCANPAALKAIETTLFKRFPRLYRLETQRAGPTGQGAQRLTPKNPVLSW